ncbi:MAG: aspartate-semialdehyde dehydrogenase [Fimbriimonadaceae bacterium]
MAKQLSVAVLGATGAVGAEFIRIFEQRAFPISELKLLASSRSAGKEVAFKGEKVVVKQVSPEAFQGVELAFFSAGAARSREFAPHALEAGAVVVDNSSAFRMDPDVPLVVPEVNSESMPADKNLIANPNCCAAILTLSLAPLKSLGNIKRLIVSTYQSASGAGAAAMQELEQQTKDVLEGKTPAPKVMPHVYAFNLFSHNTPIDEQGLNEEEAKVIEETRKILDLPELGVNVTCIRVPVLRAHSLSVTAEFEGPAPDEETVRRAITEFPGLELLDDREKNFFPMPLDASHKDDVLVGRIRRDPSNPNALVYFAAGDQLLKGAALNAVQIGEHLIRQGKFS